MLFEKNKQYYEKVLARSFLTVKPMKAFRSQPHKLKIHHKTLWQLTERIKNELGHEGLAIFYAYIFLVKQA